MCECNRANLQYSVWTVQIAPLVENMSFPLEVVGSCPAVVSSVFSEFYDTKCIFLYLFEV